MRPEGISSPGKEGSHLFRAPPQLGGVLGMFRLTYHHLFGDMTEVMAFVYRDQSPWPAGPQEKAPKWVLRGTPHTHTPQKGGDSLSLGWVIIPERLLDKGSRKCCWWPWPLESKGGEALFWYRWCHVTKEGTSGPSGVLMRTPTESLVILWPQDGECTRVHSIYPSCQLSMSCHEVLLTSIFGVSQRWGLAWSGHDSHDWRYHPPQNTGGPTMSRHVSPRRL